MRVPSFPVMLAGVALALPAGVADAYTCYMLLDAKDSIVYQDTIPPVDMSEQGMAARDALRQLGNYLLIVELDHCLPQSAAPGSAGASPATPADYVRGVRPVLVSTGATGVPAGPPSGGGGNSTAPSAPASPVSAPATTRRTTPGAY
jgi:hypothetical protein